MEQRFIELVEFTKEMGYFAKASRCPYTDP